MKRIFLYIIFIIQPLSFCASDLIFASYNNGTICFENNIAIVKLDIRKNKYFYSIENGTQKRSLSYGYFNFLNDSIIQITSDFLDTTFVNSINYYIENKNRFFFYDNHDKSKLKIKGNKLLIYDIDTHVDFLDTMSTNDSLLNYFVNHYPIYPDSYFYKYDISNDSNFIKDGNIIFPFDMGIILQNSNNYVKIFTKDFWISISSNNINRIYSNIVMKNHIISNTIKGNSIFIYFSKNK
ncbi:MAG TPA: hypothetical protein PKO18_01255 [Chitinophagales bacterium]|nr:hypothetical protein [Chitinophagales bacterium]HNL83830.1 hypothetical protein [Chitinophagales bacterium]